MPSLDEDFRFVLPQMGAARGTPSPERQRLLVWGAIYNASNQVMVKKTSYSTSGGKLAEHLDYISRQGENEVLDRDGNSFSKDANPREALQLYGREMVIDSQRRKSAKGQPRKRVSMNLMLSMPGGTDKRRFELGVSDFLAREFGEHDYVYTFHGDRDHYHAHAAIGMLGRDGKWLHPTMADFMKWRQDFADSLLRHGISASATPSHSRGRRKSSARRVPRKVSPSRAAHEDADIEERRKAWTRIARHYRQTDKELAEDIDGFVATQFGARKETAERSKRQGRSR